MSEKYFATDERVIYSCKKNCYRPFALFFSGIILFLPVGIIPLVARVPLEVGLICISTTVLYFTFCFLLLGGHRKSCLILTNHRLFLRYSIFYRKLQAIPFESVIPLESIESFKYVDLGKYSHYLISTTDGRKIMVEYPFILEELEKLAGHINVLKNRTTYLEPEKKKFPTPWINAIAYLVLPILVVGLHFFFNETEKKQARADRELQVAIKKKAIKATKKRRMKKMTRMEKEYKRLASLDITLNKKPAEYIRLWKRFLAAYIDDIPGETTDEQLKKDAWEMIIHLQGGLPTGDPLRGIRLRSVYNENLWEEEWISALGKYGFFDSIKNGSGGFRHQYQVISLHGDKVVLDYTTGLMWHPGGFAESGSL